MHENYNSFLMIKEIWRNQYASFLQEDGIHRDLNWLHSLPEDPVKAVIAIKSPLIMAGLPIALGLIDHLNDRFIDKDFYENIIKHESRHFAKDQSIEFEMPFNLFIVAERTFLNILHRGCAIASTANFYAERAKKFNIAILETRKTTPGLRSLEKYSAIIGGAKGHRFDLADSLMIKDNHKKFFGGLEKSWRFFNEHNVAYRNIIVEIHNLEELKVATKLGVKHVMLDNFKPEKILEAINLKTSGMTFEVSGGIDESNFDSYLIKGVDYISIGSITFWPKKVDLSLKIRSKND